VIAIRAGAAQMRRDPERSQAALEAIEDLARKTVAEIDQIVGAVRDEGSASGTVDAPPGLASLDTLIARHAAAGLDVTISSEGAPRQLESAVDQAACWAGSVVSRRVARGFRGLRSGRAGRR
jgi:hypothetical protein